VLSNGRSFSFSASCFLFPSILYDSPLLRLISMKLVSGLEHIWMTRDVGKRVSSGGRIGRRGATPRDVWRATTPGRRREKRTEEGERGLEMLEKKSGKSRARD
jgi:hypothetical protein